MRRKYKITTNRKAETRYKRYLSSLLTITSKPLKVLDADIDLEKILNDFKVTVDNVSEAQIKAFLDRYIAQILEGIQIPLPTTDENYLKDEEKIIQLFSDSNILLATNLIVTQYRNVGQVITNGIIEGIAIPEITRNIQAVTSKSKFQAETIAITETAKVNSQINRRRMKGLGITKAVWSSAKDKRVRRCHLARDGKEFNIDVGCLSNCDGAYIQVGQEVRCRCAMSVILF